MSDISDRLTSALSDRYRIERELGRGGMATVYLAEDLKHDRQVAIKVLRPELSASLGAERFLQEIRIAAKLTHPHILPLHDSGEADGFLYYVMPYIAGESLRDRLEREKQLPIQDALKITSEVADALAFAHDNNVVHRDIKPENILIEAKHAVVADFGVARAISVAGEARLTETGMAIGTPAYLSPEQASGDVELDGRSDVYSLGCMLYEMLAGQPPFMGTTPESILRQHVSATPAPVAVLRPTVSDQVVQVVDKALAKSPADRYSTARQFVEALNAAQLGLSAPTVAVKRRSPLPIVAAAGAVVVLVALVFGLWPRGSAPERLPRLVVLPFENLGAPEDEYFADGITDEITSRMARLSGLEVIARTSAMQYKDTDKTASQIAAELDVDYLLEGTVRWSKPPNAVSRVRVSPELIRGSDETHVWAEPFEGELADVFGLQANVAEMVAQALHVSLGSGETEAVPDLPTENMEAYDHYLRGNAVFNQRYPWGPGLVGAIEQYEIAVQLDPSFALAFAKLSLAVSNLGYEESLSAAERAERNTKKRETAEEALRLDPDLPEGHAALGVYHYDCCRDFAKAQTELELALVQRPNDPFLIYLSAGPYKRGGNLERAAALNARASDLDPANWSMAQEAFRAYELLRQYDRAERYLERWAATRSGQFEQMPTLVAVYYYNKVGLMLKRDGNVDAAREILQEGQQGAGLGYWELVTSLLNPYTRVMCIHDTGACREGLRQATYRDGGIDDVDYYMTMADLYHWVGDEALSRAYYDSAATAAVAERDQVLASPQPWWRQLAGHQFPAYMARIEASRGDTAAAKAYLQQSLDEWPNLVDRWAATLYEAAFPAAESYLLVGDIDAALERLEFWLSRPSYLSVAVLRVDPMWDPLRDDPRFQALLERYRS